MTWKGGDLVEEEFTFRGEGGGRGDSGHNSAGRYGGDALRSRGQRLVGLEGSHNELRLCNVRTFQNVLLINKSQESFRGPATCLVELLGPSVDIGYDSVVLKSERSSGRNQGRRCVFSRFVREVGYAEGRGVWEVGVVAGRRDRELVVGQGGVVFLFLDGRVAEVHAVLFILDVYHSVSWQNRGGESLNRVRGWPRAEM